MTTLMDIAQTKVCSTCKRDLPLDQYQKASKAKDGRQWICKDCMKVRQAEWHKKNVDTRRWYFREKRYGVSKDKFDEMLDSQGGGCAICHTPLDEKTSYVDHCHTTGVTRGILCNRCNIAVSVFDNMPELIDQMHDYLNKYKATP